MVPVAVRTARHVTGSCADTAATGRLMGYNVASDEPGIAHRSPAEGRPAETGAAEVRAFETGAANVRAAETGAAEVRTAKTGAPDVRTATTKSADHEAGTAVTTGGKRGCDLHYDCDSNGGRDDCGFHERILLQL